METLTDAQISVYPSGMLLERSQLQALGRGNFFARLHSFLMDRVRPLPLRNLLEQQAYSVHQIWHQVLDAVDPGSEYSRAILLSYAFCRWRDGYEPVMAARQMVASADGEYQAKCYFENAGILRFSEFDLHLCQTSNA